MSYPPHGNKADTSGLATAANLASLDAKVALDATVAKNATVALDATVAKATDLATVLSRLIAVRATYLDELAAANLPADVAANYDATIEHDEHFHTLERWFGKSADQSGTNWATEVSLTTFQATSGVGVFGTAIKVVGSTDTPVVAGKAQFDAHTIFVQSTQAATIYILRFIWGTGDNADVEEAAGRYSDSPYMREAANGRGAPVDHRMPRLAVGTKVWVKTKNAAAQTIDFYVGLHEYN